MKRHLSIIAAISVTLIAACKKSNDIPAPAPAPQEPTPRISATYQSIANGLAINLIKTFEYDAENRLKEIKFTSSNNITISERYNYTGNLIQYRYISGTTEISTQSADYTLNNNGRAENWIHQYSNTTNIYEYNNSGYITRINYTYNSSGIGYDIYHYGSNHVLDSISCFALTNAKKNVVVFAYETGRKNTIGNENKGLKMLGQDQSAPVKSKMIFTYTGSSRRKDQQNNYTYTYSDDGRIAKMTNTIINYSNGIPVQTFITEELEYTYKQ